MVLENIIDTVERRGIAVYLSGVRDGHHKPLEALDVITRLAAAGRIFVTTPEAITAARHQPPRQRHAARQSTHMRRPAR